MDLNDLTYVLHSIIDNIENNEQHDMLIKLANRVIESTRVCMGMVGTVERMILHVLLEKNEYARMLVERLKTKTTEINQKERKRMSEHMLPVLLKIITMTTTTTTTVEKEKGENGMSDSRMQLFHMLTGWLIGNWQALKQTVFQWLDWRWRLYEKEEEEEGRMQLDGEQSHEWVWRQGERIRVAWIQEHLLAIQQQQVLLEEGEREEYVSCLQWILSISNQCITNHVSDGDGDGDGTDKETNCRCEEDNQQLEHSNSLLTTSTTTTEMNTLGRVLSHTFSTIQQPISKESISFILRYYFRYLQSEQSIMKVAIALIPILQDIQQIVEKQGGKEEFQKWMDSHSFFVNMSEHSFVIYQE